ncbi:MAG: zinc dependent phospholipase C family protein [Cyclobacteriaceae bacterium]
MRKTLLLTGISLIMVSFRPMWGFFAHEKINRLAIFTLPPALIGFYKQNIDFITDEAVSPDKRRYAVEEEAPRHYLDVDHYGDSTFTKLSHDWHQAVAAYGEDKLVAYGILPWHIFQMYQRLRDAFMVKDPGRILRVSAELGHYIADANVPLHTTQNYNGQLTGQEGIHGLWESRLPELFSGGYDFFVGHAEYIDDPREAAWQAIVSSHQHVKTVLMEEKKLASRYEEKRYAFETRGNVTVKVFAPEYSRDYHRILGGMVEKQMRTSIKMIGDFWYTAWVDAGQPDLKLLIDYKPTEAELRNDRERLRLWKENRHRVREHEEVSSDQ